MYIDRVQKSIQNNDGDNRKTACSFILSAQLFASKKKKHKRIKQRKCLTRKEKNLIVVKIQKS